jgi:phosphonopyruvate decarboxylase
MIRADFFIDAMSKAGFGLFTGVPCSYLTPFINTVIDTSHIHYVPAANEGDAVAIACGAELGGRRSVVMFQNSGLGNAVSPLTSLTSTFKLPVLVITTWRGQPGGPEDEPQHEMMGQITPSLLELMGIPWELFPSDEANVEAVINRAIQHMDTHRTPYALIMPYGIVQAQEKRSDAGPTKSEPMAQATGVDVATACSIAPEAVNHSSSSLKANSAKSKTSESSGSEDQLAFSQDEALLAIQASVNASDAVLATTGFTGRALYALDDRANQFYMVGSMGCVSSFGLGLATARPDRRIIVIDGDGALLMRMGALATNGFHLPPNLVHIVLDNGCHDSTGSQSTVASCMNMVQLASACGYPRSVGVSTLEALSRLLQENRRELTFVHVKTIARQNRKLPRPVVSPAEVANRFRAWLVAPSIAENSIQGHQV